VIFEVILGVADSSRGGLCARFAPMGAEPEGNPVRRALLRPFAASRTGTLLLKERRGVLNVVDDAYLFAQTALSDDLPPHDGAALKDACEWWEIEVESPEKEDRIHKDNAKRREVLCKIIQVCQARPPSPFNRARHAVLEAVILATRRDLDGFDKEAFARQMREWRTIIEKTGGEREIAAFCLIQSKL